jgi:tRNA U34 5-methylaminomethyl-2-thiouridine-forming methyltransferase MnmC
VPNQSGYRIVKLARGAHSVHSLAEGETFHPVVGPVTEAEALYVRQLGLVDRIQHEPGEFVVWDVGLGAAANPLTLLRAARHLQRRVRIVSFDHKLEPLQFALGQTQYLPYLSGYEPHLHLLLKERHVDFRDDSLQVAWELHLGDFPTLIKSPAATHFPKPHAIMFDAFSPASNPAMWTLPLFTDLFALLDPHRPCALPTYSRSTILRVTLLLAGFFVGVGHATGEKEETTVAANRMELIKEPLTARWLDRVQRSTSAEPLQEPVYRQAPLTAQSMTRLRQHPQFQSS